MERVQNERVGGHDSRYQEEAPSSRSPLLIDEGGEMGAKQIPPTTSKSELPVHIVAPQTLAWFRGLQKHVLCCINAQSATNVWLCKDQTHPSLSAND